MHSVLTLDRFSLAPKGSTVSLRVGEGHLVLVYAPASGGKSAFLKVLAGEGKAAQGTVSVADPIFFAEPGSPPRRQTPQSIAVKHAGRDGSQNVAEALTATGLWQFRQKSAASLTGSRAAALELLPVLAAPKGTLLIDGGLDRVDPLVFSSVMELLRRRQKGGSTVVIATHRPELARAADLLIGFRQLQPIFAGTYEELERKFGEVVYEVEAQEMEGVRALLDPFEVRYEADGERIVLRANEGQSLAARLLLEGYGNVKAVVVRPPQPDELISALLRS